MTFSLNPGNSVTECSQSHFYLARASNAPDSGKSSSENPTTWGKETDRCNFMFKALPHALKMNTTHDTEQQFEKEYSQSQQLSDTKIGNFRKKKNNKKILF